jgi:hypothetical protein
LGDVKWSQDPTLIYATDVGRFFTIPLQGALFTNFRDVLLGYKHIDSLALDPPPPLEERVGRPIERANGRETDELDEEGFTLVQGKKLRESGTVTRNTVEQVPNKTRGRAKSAYE